ncbi:MAG: carbohydrate binding family 9 domain-containing protein [Acidobacteria bacterium]|nr:carbohydrate binding family 9 domain-containing protein [Acidobacteriota bacterium]
MPISRRSWTGALLLGLVSVSFLNTSPAAAQAAAEPAPAQAADAAIYAPNEPARSLKEGKVVRAFRLVGTPPSIDGRLNDEAWAAADSAGTFVQRDPNNGEPATESTLLQFAYDDRYLYVAVTCLDSTPAVIAAGLGRRDEFPATDYIGLAFDPRHDHQTGYLFETNPSAVQRDYAVSDDDRFDLDYNAVWEVRTQITQQGWTAEFRIPFSQMRFSASPQPGQVWGLNSRRQIRRKGEFQTWVPKPRGERGEVSLFGHLVFDAPLSPPRRVEILPYALSRAERGADGVGDVGAAVGADVRVGLGSAATLSATVNPDFGQVEQDPAVLNLSVFETFFPEKRPFFLEDSRTFVPPYGIFQLFHSRRIGRAPGRFPLTAGDQLVERPDETTILGAAKR